MKLDTDASRVGFKVNLKKSKVMGMSMRNKDSIMINVWEIEDVEEPKRAQKYAKREAE